MSLVTSSVQKKGKKYAPPRSTSHVPRSQPIPIPKVPGRPFYNRRSPQSSLEEEEWTYYYWLDTGAIGGKGQNAGQRENLVEVDERLGEQEAELSLNFRAQLVLNGAQGGEAEGAGVMEKRSVKVSNGEDAVVWQNGEEKPGKSNHK
ncbi:uncharacterized protein LOC118436960 [Folsomia candida]|uniref:Uncharacterized protein n=1 Tax=Folsomia candida TaxID=158441 RepID=A0A226DSN3_FOLCA|nr:uncharacterized protein LOC118436960 [Folsomia candida]OXA48492.1 hypothetical protein Fcan01_16732 [Folsomia candida]